VFDSPSYACVPSDKMRRLAFLRTPDVNYRKASFDGRLQQFLILSTSKWKFVSWKSESGEHRGNQPEGLGEFFHSEGLQAF
jgi:hypothetical protein